MYSSVKKSLLSTPAWASSVITALSSLFIPFIIAGIGLPIVKLFGFSSQVLTAIEAKGDLIGYLITGIFVAIMCFIICKAHPKSVWYTPIISNGMTLWMGGNYFTGNLQLNELLLSLGIGWILSIIASIWGRNIGIRSR